MTPEKQPRPKKQTKPSRLIRTLAANLRRMRLERELSQEALAKKAELDYKHYQKIEGGAWPALRLETVERLAHALKVTVVELLTE